MNRHTPARPIAVMIGQLAQGGSERQLFFFLAHCDRALWQPHVFVSGELGYWERPIRELGIPITLLQGSQIAKLRQLRAACLAAGIKHFFSWSSYTNGYALALQGLGARRIGSFRNFMFADLPEQRRWMWAWLSLAGISIAVCNSRATYEAMGRHVGRRKQLVFVPNSVEQPADPAGSRARWRAQLGIGDDETLVAGVGRLAPQKNFGRFIDTVALVRAETPVRAVVAGEDYGCLAELERRRDAAGLAPDTLRFIGPVPDARELICAADILLLTSDYEGTPNVVLEAMTAGTPVVCTSSSNGGDLLEDGREGFVVAPTAPALASKVKQLACNKELGRALSAASAARARQQYDPKTIAARLWALCEA